MRVVLWAAPFNSHETLVTAVAYTISDVSGTSVSDVKEFVHVSGLVCIHVALTRPPYLIFRIGRMVAREHELAKVREQFTKRFTKPITKHFVREVHMFTKHFVCEQTHCNHVRL